ncbi:MAG: hypothetical protein AB2A00_29620 [Myxococcota bacterium]
MTSQDAPEDVIEEEEAWGSGPRRVADVFRRAVLGGMGSLLTTEEGLRSVVSELKLPKEAVGYLLQQADRTKADLIKALGRELRSFLDNVDITHLVTRAMTGLTLEIKAEVRFKPSGEGQDDLIPVVAKVSARRKTGKTERPARKKSRPSNTGRGE